MVPDARSVTLRVIDMDFWQALIKQDVFHVVEERMGHPCRLAIERSPSVED